MCNMLVHVVGLILLTTCWAYPLLEDIPDGCLRNQFECLSGQYCIPKMWKCDGQVDCLDESDEKNCNKLCTETEFLCSTGSCVSRSFVCDGKKDCSDGSDEGSHCGTSCSNITCSQKCRISPSGPQCYCKNGYSFDTKDNKTCLDIDECLEDGFCSQECVNTEGNFTCSCLEGYELVNRSCKATGGDPLLIFSTINEIRGMSLRVNRSFLVRRATGKPTAVDVDPANQRIYWVEISNKPTIYSSKEDGSEFRTILSHGLLLPEDIAVDQVANNLYLTDSGLKQVLACKMDGTMCYVLHDKNVEKPRSLVLDLVEGWMYWSDCGESASGIYRSGMDGSQRIAFVSRGVAWPSGMAIDRTTNRLYWADSILSTIEYITLDGITRKVVLHEMFNPHSLAIFEDTIYWSDQTDYSLRYCNKFKGSQVTLLDPENDRQFMGVRVYHPVLYSGVSNPCSSNTCSHMCLIAPTGKFQCVCPPELALAADGQTCARKEETQFVFVTDASSVFIMRPERVGSEIIEEIPLTLPTALISRVAYDWESKMLFAANQSPPSIIAINMTSLKKWDLVKNQHIEAPVDLAFDRMAKNLFWVDKVRGTVEVISIRDLYRARIIDGLVNPVALAISPERGLLFVATEVNGNTQFPVTMYDINGKNGRFLNSVQGYPMSLALHPSETLLYWTDPRAGLVSCTNYLKLDTPRVLKSGLDGVLSVDASEKHVYWVTKRNELNFMKDNFTYALSLPGADKGIAIKRDTFSDGRTTAITTCGDNEFKCKLNGRCIPLKLKCDGSRDCSDGSDEMGCSLENLHQLLER